MIKNCFLVLLCILFFSCHKTKTTTNNTTIIVAPTQPAFAINGLTDITFTNNFFTTTTLNLTVQYLDSAQENVTLSLSGLPAGLALDTTWISSGIPTFSTRLSLFDTMLAGGAVPGSYPLKLTATTLSGKQKVYSFNLKIQPRPTSFLGKYDSCHLYCGAGGTYSDSVYADPSVANKIWFTNFENTGDHVYALLGSSADLSIPAQTVNGHNYSGGGSITIPHYINISLSTSCAINMN